MGFGINQDRRTFVEEELNDSEALKLASDIKTNATAEPENEEESIKK